jgi:hypothetical protein
MHHLKDIFKGYKISSLHFRSKFDVRNIYERPKFWENNNLSFGIPIRESQEKWYLDVVSIKRHIIYYREGSGAFSQRLWAMWSLCLKLTLLNSSHHFYSTYINRLFFLVVQVDIILNFCLWIHPSPISELQHNLLHPKCYKLGIVPQLFSSFVVFILRPTFGSFEEFGGASICMCSHYNWLIIQRFFNLWNKTIHIWIFVLF